MKCKKCGKVTNKKLKYCPECGAKMSSNLGLIITLIVFIVIIIVFAIVFITYNILKSPYVGTWTVTNAYNDITITETLKISSNMKFSYNTTDTGSTSNYIVEGTWKNAGDHIELTYSSSNEKQQTVAYLLDKKTICLNKEKCDELSKFTKKGLFTSKNKNIIDKDYYTKDEDDDWKDIESTNSDSAKKTTDSNYSFDNKYDKAIDEDKVVVYIFHGDGCPHCTELFEALDKLDNNIKNKFVVRKFETWYNEANSDLMNKVAKSRKEEGDLGVPYIIIGNKSWNGYTESYKEEMIKTIESEYEKPASDRYDIGKELDF